MLLLCFLLPWSPQPAQGAGRGILDAIRAEQWAEADAQAAAEPDPIARKLVLFYRLLTPGAARADEIAAFIADNAAWPQQAALARRLQEASPGERDDAAVRRTWVAGIIDPVAEAAFMRQWGRIVLPEDQWRRFDRLAWNGNGAPGGPAARQAVRLGPAFRAAAEARLALRRDDPVAPALVALLPAPARNDPAMVLDLARWYRRAGQDRDAARVWAGLGAAAEQAAPPEQQPAFWDERNLLARRLLHTGENALAYEVASAPAAPQDAAVDAAFLAGWIALRRLNQPDDARRYFETLAGLSHAAITQGRAHYWLARTAAFMGDAARARAEYAIAARWPTTYYGQLAALALGADPATPIHTARDPAWSMERALEFAGGELPRAASVLAAWGEPRRAKAFLQRLDETAPDEASRALTARFALSLGLPEQAVATARRAGRDGMMLPEAGWPEAAAPPSGRVEPAVTLGLIRQESSFDTQATSPSGARGLMQLMPATAAGIARRLGDAGEPLAALPAGLMDPATNMRLGTAYLQGLLDRFGGALPLALAGYNAGPSRVQDWLGANGDPAAGQVDMIDWIELIPFNETRNYVQRVIENVVIYRVQRGETAAHPLSRPQG